MVGGRRLSMQRTADEMQGEMCFVRGPSGGALPLPSHRLPLLPLEGGEEQDAVEKGHAGQDDHADPLRGGKGKAGLGPSKLGATQPAAPTKPTGQHQLTLLMSITS